MIKRDYAEKRDFIRMTINAPAEIYVEEEGATAHGICNDLSGSGMLLTVDKELPTDSELVVSLNPKEENGPILQAKCAIARLRKVDEGCYLLGLEILKIMDNETTQVA